MFKLFNYIVASILNQKLTPKTVVLVGNVIAGINAYFPEANIRNPTSQVGSDEASTALDNPKLPKTVDVGYF